MSKPYSVETPSVDTPRAAADTEERTSAARLAVRVQRRATSWLALPVERPRGLVRWGEIVLPVIAIVVAFVLPSRLVVAGLGAAGRPAVVLGVGLLFLWLFTQLRPGVARRASVPLRVLVSFYWASLLISYAAGYDRGLTSVEASASDRTMIVALGATGVLLVVAEGVRSKAALDRLLQTMAVGATAMSLVGVLQAYGLDLVRYIQVPGLSLNRELIGVAERGSGGFARVAGTAGHYIEFGTVAALLLPLVIHFWRRSGAKLLSWWSLAVLLVAVAVPFSISRTSILAGGVSIAVYLLSLGWRQRVNALAVGAVAILGFQALRPGVLGTIRSLFENLDNDPSVQGRTDDYPIVFAYIADRPILGRGTGTFEPSVYLVLDNQLLMTVVTTGYLGLAAILSLVLGGVVAMWLVIRATPDPVDRDLGYALAAAVVAGLAVSLTFDSLAFAVFSTTLWVSTAAGFALLRLTRRDRSSGEPPAGQRRRRSPAVTA